jgi:hypothetical protein
MFIQQCRDHPILSVADPGPQPRNLVDLDTWRRRQARRRYGQRFINGLDRHLPRGERLG